MDDPTLGARAQKALAAKTNQASPNVAAQSEINAHVEADRSSAFPVFMFIAFACLWLLVGSAGVLISAIKLHAPDWLAQPAWLSFRPIRNGPPTGVINGVRS